MSDNHTTLVKAAQKPVNRFTLEEKVWMDRRKNDLQTYGSIGGGIGTMVAVGLTTARPVDRRLQIITLCSGFAMGGLCGLLYADTKALERVDELSAKSSLRKEYHQQVMEMKGARK